MLKYIYFVYFNFTVATQPNPKSPNGLFVVCYPMLKYISFSVFFIENAAKSPNGLFVVCYFVVKVLSPVESISSEIIFLQNLLSGFASVFY